MRDIEIEDIQAEDLIEIEKLQEEFKKYMINVLGYFEDEADYIISEVLEPRHIPYVETRSLEGALPDLDILYMTRVQRERFFNEEDYVRLKNSYVLNADKLALAPPDMAVLHPLPRVNEITLDVDDDPRAAYFEQATNGVYMRMALIMTLLGLKDPKTGEVAFPC